MDDKIFSHSKNLKKSVQSVQNRYNLDIAYFSACTLLFKKCTKVYKVYNFCHLNVSKKAVLYTFVQKSVHLFRHLTY